MPSLIDFELSHAFVFTGSFPSLAFEYLTIFPVVS